MPSGLVGRGGGGNMAATSGRAARAVALLVGFYALGFGTLALLVGLDVVCDRLGMSGTDYGRVLIASAVMALPILRGIFFTRGNRMRKPPGVAVGPAEQPVLWRRTAELARAMGTRPPREIRITADVNAAVHENARLLGLLPGKRRMFIGAPLLIGLSPAQLDAVLAHELGHYSHQDTRLAGLVHRGRSSMTNTLRLYAKTSGAGSLMFGVYRSYAENYLRTTQAISREQEHAADLAAARIAGRDNTASALRQIPALDAGFGFYLTHYAAAGRDFGLLPTADEYLGGFRHLLADPRRAAELDAIRSDPPTGKPTPYDSHPPITERVAAIEALPDDGRGRDSGNAVQLVHQPAPLFAAVARAALAPEQAKGQQLDWAALTHATGRARAFAAAGPLLGATAALSGGNASLTLLLDLVDQGRLDEVAAQLPEPAQAKGTTGRLRAQHLRTGFAHRLRALVQVTLADAGSGGWPLSWSRDSVFEVRPGLLPDTGARPLDAALDPVVALQPSTEQLRRLMHQLTYRQ
jgi:Zn-dependent protease with chaperone function